MIGVVDKDKQYNQRKSYDSGNAVSYDGRWRQIWYGDENGKLKSK